MLEEAGEAPDRAAGSAGTKPPGSPPAATGKATRWITSPRRLPWLLVALSLVPVIAIALVASVSLTVAPAGVIDLTRSLLATDLASRPERLMLPSTSTIELTAALRTSRPAASTSSERVWNSAIRAMAMTGTRESATSSQGRRRGLVIQRVAFPVAAGGLPGGLVPAEP
ncbi:MAG: hypothetical protein ACKOTH_04040, partial [Solirubrobacterales bacterium]